MSDNGIAPFSDSAEIVKVDKPLLYVTYLECELLKAKALNVMMMYGIPAAVKFIEDAEIADGDVQQVQRELLKEYTAQLERAKGKPFDTP